MTSGARLALVVLCIGSAACTNECDSQRILDYYVFPASQTIVAGQAARYQVFVLSKKFRGSTVQIRVDPDTLPPGARVSFEPSAEILGDVASVLVETRTDTPAGRYQISVSAIEVGAPLKGVGVQSVALQVAREPDRTIEPPLEVGCSRAPASGPAPLTVRFLAEFANCVGPCRFSWSFDDGQHANEAEAQHTYRVPGIYMAIGTLSDDRERAVSCRRRVDVLPEEHSPGPTPGPGPTPKPTPTPTPTAPPHLSPSPFQGKE